MRAYERLLNYVRVHTTSDENSGTHPSAEREFDLARQLVEELRQIGPKSVLITSIPIDGQPSVIGYNHQTGTWFTHVYTEIPVHFPGTGDIFSAILIGHLLNGTPLEASTRRAMDGVYTLIDHNKDNEDKNRGIPVEQFLSLL